jgi:hypothetical protein
MVMKMEKAIRVLVVIGASLLVASDSRVDSISLAGHWRFELDRADAGSAHRWFERTLSGNITLPGSLPAQGVGDDVTVETRWTGGIVDRSWFTAPQYEKYRQPGNVKVPFWLQPDKYYSGAAWYQRDIEIPAQWKGRRVVLTLERPHWETRVWLDGTPLGSNNSLSTPHDYDLGRPAPGKHQLTIRVSNARVVDIGENSHGISDHTQGNWNGIAGRIELRSTPVVWIEDVKVTPNIARHSVLVDVHIGNSTGKRGKGTVRIWKGTRKLSPFPEWALPVSWDADKNDYEPPYPPPHPFSSIPPLSQHGRVKMEVTFGEAALWDEFNPALQHMIVELKGDSADDTRIVRFGMRDIAATGTQFAMNGRATFIRGTLECGIFPKTGHPPTEVAEWKRIISVAKDHGLNLMRFHSYCPPEAAFVAADELGFYLQVETCWANQSTTLGDGKPVDRWVYDETDRILKAYGNHPSFILMAAGNEPGGKNHAAYAGQWVKHHAALDTRRLFTGGSGWPQLPENQFHVAPDPRIQAWGSGLKSRINSGPPETVTDYREYIAKRTIPVISHEIGQWCVYPNFDEIPKYTGYLKARNFEIFRDSLDAHHMAGQARQFLMASGKLQALCYKEDIESALRTPGMAGFQLLDLHDFPGQGTALVGVLDPFWEEKGYITAAEYRRFCNSTVPLARLPKRVFTTDETLEAGVEVAHFGPEMLNDAATRWKLVDDNGGIAASGVMPSRNIPAGNGISLGNITIPLAKLQAPRRYRLVVNLAEFENDWQVWIYPARLETTVPDGVTIVEELDAKARAALESGGGVLLLIPPQRVRNAADRDEVKLGFSSIFWNTAWTARQAPTTLGILCDPKHLVFAEFPTDFHSNWQWWYLVTRAAPMILDGLPAGLQPTVQVIDDWFTARKLGLVFEGRVGRGRLVVCSITLDDANPVARQFRHSLLRYMASDRFRPKHQLSLSDIDRNILRGLGGPGGKND